MKKIMVALVATLVAMSVGACAYGYGKGKGPPPRVVTTKG
jgi:hypothetical protein